MDRAGLFLFVGRQQKKRFNSKRKLTLAYIGSLGVVNVCLPDRLRRVANGYLAYIYNTGSAALAYLPLY